MMKLEMILNKVKESEMILNKVEEMEYMLKKEIDRISPERSRGLLKLKVELYAEKVIQQEESHLERWEEWHGDSYDQYCTYETKKIIDKPRIAVPDEEERACAKEALEVIFKNTHQGIIKYRAGKILGLPEDELKKIGLAYLEQAYYYAKEGYKSSDSDKRIASGKILGYSRLRTYLNDFFRDIFRDFLYRKKEDLAQKKYL